MRIRWQSKPFWNVSKILHNVSYIIIFYGAIMCMPLKDKKFLPATYIFL